MNTCSQDQSYNSKQQRIAFPLVLTEAPISVVVVTYQRAQHLRWCLEALALQSLPHDEYEIVIVDDGGTDNSIASVEAAQAAYPSLDVRYVWHEHDGWGLSRSRNEGAALTRGDCILSIDSDILLNPEALEVYTDLYYANPHRVIGGYYRYLKGMKITLAAIKAWQPIWDMELEEVAIPQHEYHLLGTDVREAHFKQGWTAVNLFADESKTYPEPFSLLGGNIMVPRHIWKQTEGFNETFTHYGGEDAEFSLQIAQLGYPFSYSLAAAGCHMAHPKHSGAEDKTNQALDHIKQIWPRWFTSIGNPIWEFAGWRKPE